MGLFGKKKKEETGELAELPELPELPPLPESIEQSPKGFFKGFFQEKPEIKNELPPLPSFPLSPVGERISNEAVKQAVREPEYILETKPKTREIEEESYGFIKPIQPITKEIMPVKVEPVFVRIDKYKEALTLFNEIKKKVLEIEQLLRNIMEIKAREENQLQEWEQEILEAKAKLDSIDKTIFKKLEE